MFHHNDNLYRNQTNVLYNTEIFSEQSIKLMNQYNWNFVSGNLNNNNNASLIKIKITEL